MIWYLHYIAWQFIWVSAKQHSHNHKDSQLLFSFTLLTHDAMDRVGAFIIMHSLTFSEDGYFPAMLPSGDK